MTSLRKVAGVLLDLEHAWPELIEATDPHAGDERLPDPMEAATLAQAAENFGVEVATVAAWDRAFLAAWDEALNGGPLAPLLEAARPLALQRPFKLDGRGPKVPPRPYGDDVAIDIVEDLLPDVGVIAPGRVLGPWSELRLPRRVHQAAAAVFCFPPSCRHGMRAAARVSAISPKPPMPVRQWLEGVTMAPAMLWEVQPEGGLEPLLDLAPRWRPEGVVTGVPAGSPHVLGRAVLHAGGWHLACALPVGEVDDIGPIDTRMKLEGWRLRRHEHRLKWEDLLRDRSEVLYRATCEMGWQRWPDRLWRVWQHWDS